VAVFDHHCKWLNNCVGKKNYKYFLGSVIGASVFLAIQIAFGVVVLVSCYSSEDTMRRRLATAFGCSSAKDEASGLCIDGEYHVSLVALRVIHIVLLAFLVPWLFMIGQLTLFHFQLCTSRSVSDATRALVY
jgi:NADH:ubiquinone oxidoreductase subunit 3 (subunit A)